MKAIAATRIFDELPPMADVLARKVTVLGSTGSIGVNTLDVISHVRKLHGPDAMPIVALAEKAGDLSETRARAGGFAETVVKPYSPRELYGAMQSALEQPSVAVGIR